LAAFLKTLVGRLDMITISNFSKNSSLLMRLITFILTIHGLAACTTLSQTKSGQDGENTLLPADVKLKKVDAQVPGSNAKRQANFYFSPSFSLSRSAALIVFGNQPVIAGTLQGEEDARKKIETVLSASLAEANIATYAYVLPDCSGRSAQTCQALKRVDLDEQGPVALAADIDQLCDRVQRQWLRSQNDPLVLITFGQASSIVLGSGCASRAKAIFMISPIFMQQDKAWVTALNAAKNSPTGNYDRSKLRNQAASIEATFDSMQKGLFSPEARVMGATVNYWTKWSALGPWAAKQAVKVNTPQIYVVPENDYMMSKESIAAMRSLRSTKKSNTRAVVEFGGVNAWLSGSSGPDKHAIETLVGLVKRYIKP
jgi:hypothetical protein